MMKHWYALYTKPRWEKKAYSLLLEKDIHAYCPVNKVRRRWSDRWKIVEEPLFKSYVFACLSPQELTPTRMTEGILNFVYFNGKPAIIPDTEINLIKRFLNEYETVEVQNLPLTPETPVRIISGVFMDLKGKVIREQKQKVVVEINSLGYRLVATLDKYAVEAI